MGKFLVALRNLENWFTLQKRILPWRESPSVYRVWVSEIMLQQTQVVTVIPFFERWIERFPTVEDLARADLEQVLKYWAGLGYYSRARNLHRGARQMIELGRFPQSRMEWLEIPGVGHYTAGAILSIASHQVEAILDGNVERVLSRVRRVSRQKGDAPYKSRLWRLSEIFVQRAAHHQIDPSVLNQSLMELGATVCTPKKPKCGACPLSRLCRANQTLEVESYPPKKKAKVWIHLEEKTYAWVNLKGEVLLSLHSDQNQLQKSQSKKNILNKSLLSKKWRSGLWDFPSQERWPETFLSQPFQATLEQSTRLGQIETQYVVTRHKVRRVTEVWRVLTPIHSKSWSVAIPSLGELSYRWVSPQGDLPPLGAPAQKVLNQLKSGVVPELQW
jgi:endonuclease III